MAIKFRYADLLTGTSHVGAGAVSGEARANIGLGAVYGRVMAFEFKGDDTDVDTNATLELSDADGRILHAARAIDAGTDDGTTKDTQQEAIIGTTVTTASTFGLLSFIGPLETQVWDKAGDATANTEGMVLGMFAKSPVTATIAAGTDGDWHRVGLWVEV